MSRTVTKKPFIDRYQAMIIEILEEKLAGMKAKVYLYGSRARGTEYEVSDIDLAIKSKDLSAIQLSQLKEAFHESHIPYKIDLVDFNKVDKDLKENVQKEGILVWEN